MTDWIFGLDGGGTRSRLRVESLDGQQLFYTEGTSTNIHAIGEAMVRDSLVQLFEHAYTECAIQPQDCKAGFAGSAGVDSKSDVPRFLELLKQASGVRAPLACDNDALPSLAGAHMDTEGLLLIAGTGSIALGRNREGRTVRAGGWGHILGDEGSAYRIAFEAISRSIRSHEGRDVPTRLLEAALAHFKLAEAEDFIPFIYGGVEKSVIAGFAATVAAFRNEHDELAVEIFDEAALELGKIVHSVYSPLKNSLSKPHLACKGGLIENDQALREATLAHIRKLDEEIVVVEAKADAARGACILARSMVRDQRRH